jgi:hypothetical protein
VVVTCGLDVAAGRWLRRLGRFTRMGSQLVTCRGGAEVDSPSGQDRRVERTIGFSRYGHAGSASFTDGIDEARQNVTRRVANFPAHGLAASAIDARVAGAAGERAGRCSPDRRSILTPHTA